MRDFAMIPSKIWIDGTMRELRGDHLAQALVMYLLSCTHSNMIGIYHLPMAYICEDLGSPFEGASKALSRVIEGGFCGYDESTSYVFIYNMAFAQVGKSLSSKDNRIKWVEKLLDEVPNNGFVARFLQIYGEVFHLQDRAGIASPFEAPSKPLRSQYKDKDKYQDKDNKDLLRKPKKSAEPISTSPPVAELQLIGGKAAKVTEADCKIWADAYPAIDPRAELAKIIAWLAANPSKRKTESGWRRFVNAWMAKAQDRPSYQQNDRARHGKGISTPLPSSYAMESTGFSAEALAEMATYKDKPIPI